MRKIIVLEFVTLDGIMQAPGGPEEDTSGDFKFGGWTVPYFDDYSGQIMSEQMSQPFELLLGRKTYEIFASYWPEHETDWPGINDVKKYVATNTLENPSWKNSIVLKGDIAAQLQELKQQNGPDLHVYGSGNFVQTLLKNDLADELWLKIYPITLGQGKRLFGDGTIPAAFKLIKSLVSPKGVIFANYKREGKGETATF